MKEGDRVRISIRESERGKYCSWLFDGAQGQSGTIEREYPKDMISVDKYEYLVKFDRPVPHAAEHFSPMTCLWFNVNDLLRGC